MKKIILILFLFYFIIYPNNYNVNATIIPKEINEINLTSDYFDSKVQLNISNITKNKSNLTIFCELINNTDTPIALLEDNLYLLNNDKLDMNVELRKISFYKRILVSPYESKTFKIFINNEDLNQGPYILKGILNTYSYPIDKLINNPDPKIFEYITIKIPY